MKKHTDRPLRQPRYSDRWDRPTLSATVGEYSNVGELPSTEDIPLTGQHCEHFPDNAGTVKNIYILVDIIITFLNLYIN